VNSVRRGHRCRGRFVYPVALDLFAVRRNPLVEAAFAAFPGAEIIEGDDAPKGDRNWSARA